MFDFKGSLTSKGRKRSHHSNSGKFAKYLSVFIILSQIFIETYSFPADSDDNDISNDLRKTKKSSTFRKFISFL